MTADPAPQGPEQRAHVARLASEYSPALHRYLLRRIRASAVPDIAQEVFLRFVRVSPLDRVRNPLGYLCAIASHVIREIRLRDEARPFIYDSHAAEAASELLENAAPEDVAERVALARDLEAAISQLPANQRAVLLLVKHAGFSYDEVAEQTGLTPATVRVYLAEARAKVQLLLQGQ
jgi:RNA polymerase sigma-70 factor (ECF subfamily)